VVKLSDPNFTVPSVLRRSRGLGGEVNVKSPAGELGALSRGDVDAAVLPFATALHSASRREPLLPLSDFAQWQQGVVFTTAKNIATRRNLIDRFMRAYQRGTADYQLNFLSYDDGGDFIPCRSLKARMRSFTRIHRPSLVGVCIVSLARVAELVSGMSSGDVTLGTSTG
jgi:hypothetical protein